MKESEGLRHPSHQVFHFLRVRRHLDLWFYFRSLRRTPALFQSAMNH
jgi:hypothetical protein